MSEKVLILEHVVKMYAPDIRAVNDVSLCLNQNGRASILGATGSGKTTLMRLICGIEKPSDGSITVLGDDIDALNPNQISKRVGVMMREPLFIEELTILENIMLSSLVGDGNKKNNQKRVHKLLDAMNISEIMHMRPSRVSRHKRCIVGFIRAVMLGPSLILADEPTGGLKENQANGLFDSLITFANMENIALLVLTDNPSIALKMENRYIMANGILTEDRT